MEENTQIYGYKSKDSNFEAWLNYPEPLDSVVDAKLTMHRFEPEEWWNEYFTGTMEELDAYVRTKDTLYNG